MNSIFISPDLGTNSSGGIVCNYELEFLKSISTNNIQFGYEQISPVKYGYAADNPFLIDYIAMEMISRLDLNNINLVHTYSGPFTNTVRYLKAKGIKVTSTVAAHNLQESINEFHNLGYEYPFRHMSNEKLWKIYNQYVREADIVIAPSKKSEEFLKKEGANRVEIIPHGINIPNPDTITPINDNHFSAGYLGAYGVDKGISYLVAAWSLLDYKDSELLLGGAQADQQLEPFIKKYATGGKFNLLGWIDNVSDFYNKISVYIQPSVTEGFGIEVIEAMAHARPVIVTDGCGASDCVSYENGFIVPKRDSKFIADKIDWLKNHPNELSKMGNNAREKSKQFSWDNIKGKYINLWESLIDKK